MSSFLGLIAAGWLPSASLAQEVPPNILVLVDSSESMQDFPEYLPEAFTPGFSPPSSSRPGDLGGDGPGGHFLNTGCSDPALVAAMSWFDKGSADPAKNGSIPYDSDGLDSQFFDATRFYHSRGRRLAWGGAEGPYSLMHFTSLTSEPLTTNICYQVVGWGAEYFYSPVMDECERCLATKGWWRGPLVSAKTSVSLGGPTRALDAPPLPTEALRKWVVKGGVLNLRPPKFVIARKALKDLIDSSPRARLGVATFGVDHGWYDPPVVHSRPLPDCDKATPNFTFDAADKLALKRAVNQANFRAPERPIGEALFGLGGYMSSEIKDSLWTNWFKQPLNPGAFGWPGCCNGGTYDNPYTGNQGLFWGVVSDEWVKGPKSVAGVYLPGQPWESWDPNERLMCSSTQASSVIVLTDGRPYNDNTVPITKMMDILKANGALHPSGLPLTFEPSSPETNPTPGGVNYCHLFGTTKEACDYTDYNWPTGLASTNKNFMDDVAFFLAHTDLRTDLPGNQKLRTSVVSLGSNSPMLRSIALAGEGQFLQVQQASHLREALLTAIQSSRTPLP
ncbi:hypothetical protein [Melittangium boletus]|uniref:hypothetical protein n=1 Tax=Melittangium boletus TaxID=83453 RepID=UPI0012FD02DE|nr:hypothetical protein [Melittangium boletus]